MSYSRYDGDNLEEWLQSYSFSEAFKNYLRNELGVNNMGDLSFVYEDATLMKEIEEHTRRLDYVKFVKVKEMTSCLTGSSPPQKGEGKVTGMTEEQALQLEQLKQWIDDKKLASNIGDLLAANHIYDLANLIYPENEAKVLEKYVYPEFKPIPLRRLKVAIQEERAATYGSVITSTALAATATSTAASKSLQEASIETQISIGLKEEASSSFQEYKNYLLEKPKDLPSTIWECFICHDHNSRSVQSCKSCFLVKSTNDKLWSEKGPEGKGPVFHDFTCKGCNIKPITGIRYKCTVRKNYDLCTACEGKAINHEHPMIKIYLPNQSPYRVRYVFHDGRYYTQGDNYTLTNEDGEAGGLTLSSTASITATEAKQKLADVKQKVTASKAQVEVKDSILTTILGMPSTSSTPAAAAAPLPPPPPAPAAPAVGAKPDPLPKLALGSYPAPTLTAQKSMPRAKATRVGNLEPDKTVAFWSGYYSIGGAVIQLCRGNGIEKISALGKAWHDRPEYLEDILKTLEVDAPERERLLEGFFDAERAYLTTI